MKMLHTVSTDITMHMYRKTSSIERQPVPVIKLYT
jgi:hypothetical protein